MKQIKQSGVCFLLTLVLILCAAACVSCSNGETSDPGTLTISDKTLRIGETADAAPVFSKNSYAVTYSFDGNVISIDGGKITANEPGTVVVTAKTEYHNVTFTVTVTEKTENYGKLYISNIDRILVGEQIELSPVFSDIRYIDGIRYSFDGDAIKIENGVVTALKADETVTVTAKTKYHTVVFTVATAEERGELTISDVLAWLDYPDSDFVPLFSDPAHKEELSFEYDESALQIDASKNTVKALKEGDYTVTAVSAHFKASFTVRARSVDKTALDNQGRKKWGAYTVFAGSDKKCIREWTARGKDGVSTVFIGDSFFDEMFWTNFYDDDYYGAYEAVLLGVGGSTTYDWEDWVDGWLGEIVPKNIAMHIGTNNIYDDGDDAAALTANLQRLFTMMHDKLPGTQIYWFSISQRAYDPRLQEIVRVVNENMKAWCAERDYITYVHTVDALTADMLKDGTHPKVECYTVFRDGLKEEGIDIIRKEDQ